MGIIRSRLEPTNKARNWLLLEAVARSIKSNINALSRPRMSELGVPADEPFRNIILTVFNLVLGKNGELSRQYWRDFVLRTLHDKYPGILEQHEAAPEYELCAVIDHCQLFQRLATVLGVRLSSDALKALATAPSIFEFVEPDLQHIAAKITHLNLIDYADGMAMYYEAINRTSNKETQRRLLQLSRNRLEASLSAMSSNYLAVFQLGNVLREMALVLQHDQGDCLANAIKAFESVIAQRCETSLHAQAYERYVIKNDGGDEERSMAADTTTL